MSWILAQYPWFNISLRAGAYTFRREIVMSRTDSAAVQIPGFFAGTWEIDQVHPDVSFMVRHLVVSKIHDRFDRFRGTIVANEDLARSSVKVTIDASSVNMNEPNRYKYVRSADSLEVESVPNVTFRSTAVRSEHDAYFVARVDLILEVEAVLQGGDSGV
jgi:polyisoprenoid-binding protein YceI